MAKVTFDIINETSIADSLGYATAGYVIFLFILWGAPVFSVCWWEECYLLTLSATLYLMVHFHQFYPVYRELEIVRSTVQHDIEF